MTSKELKNILEGFGFKVCHVRKMPHSTTLRAYLYAKHEDWRYGDVDEIHYHPHNPGTVELFQHATRPNGYTQYDKHVGSFTIA